MSPASSDQIKQLIQLLNAESKQVRGMIRAELRAMGDHLRDFINGAGQSLDPSVLFELEEILQQARREENSDPLAWRRESGFYNQLEAGYVFLAAQQTEAPPYAPIGRLLDETAEDFLKTGRTASASELNQYLFVEERLTGARGDYYNPLNSHLGHVLTNGEGIPITLAVALMLVADRLDVKVQGFNMPGHFLARADQDEQAFLMDCFNNGRILNREQVVKMVRSPRFDFDALIERPPTAAEMIIRGMLNLINSYYQVGAMSRYLHIQALLDQLRNEVRRKRPPKPEATTEVLFKRGVLVRHKRYGYRGVIVEFDGNCQADESWYRGNLTQPSRKQPWYHVLVDNSTATTYAAQTSLEADQQVDPIRHPLISLYFDQFNDGRYHRNEVPWNLPG